MSTKRPALNGGDGDIAFPRARLSEAAAEFHLVGEPKGLAGTEIFEGGFLGLDNIGLFDRSAPLPTGGYIQQSDGTGWMAMYCLNMLHIALELGQHDNVYDDMATKFFEHFIYIARAMTGVDGSGGGLWDNSDNFYYDKLNMPDGSTLPMRIRSMVGLIPLYAVAVVDRLRFRSFLVSWSECDIFTRSAATSRLSSRAGTTPARTVGTCFRWRACFRMTKLLERMLDEREFLSPHGVRALSRQYQEQPYDFGYHNNHYRVAISAK